jgi:hypothetical protein
MADNVHEVANYLEGARSLPDCVVIHVLRSDVQPGANPHAIAGYLHSMVEYYALKFPLTQFIISLGVPRRDDNFYIQ